MQTLSLTSLYQAQNMDNNQALINGQHHGIPVYVQRSIALLALVAISPILLITMLIIKFESQGGCFYSQTRVGKNGRYFRMYKFRSMYLKTDPSYREPDPSTSSRDGVCKKYINDPRITKIGSFIRKFSIDELPQLFNVVIGDMVLIGPRPALASEVDAYDDDAVARLHCEAGLTGLWQVSGRANTSFAQQVVLDTSYIKKQSIRLDIQIVLATIPCVLFAKGAY